MAEIAKNPKENQGQKMKTGSEGNIKTLPDSGSTDKGGTPRPARSSKHGRNISIGHEKQGRRRSPGN